MLRVFLSLLVMSWAAAATARADTLSAPARAPLDLALPGGRTQRFELSERHDSKRRWLYSNEALHGMVGQGWIEQISPLIDTARGYFDRAKALGLLPDCAIAPRRGFETMILLDSLEPKALMGSTERAGYTHPDNPGPIVEIRMWQTQGVEILVLHEMVHQWCGSRADKQSAFGKWLEEGVADWVAFETKGSSPQRAITDYFADPCRPTLYGSSFLWVLSRMLATQLGHGKADPALLLAMLHLGTRKNLGAGATAIHGSISPHPTPACASSETAAPIAYGHVASDCQPLKAPGIQECVPLRLMPWGAVQAGISSDGAGEPAGFFVWIQNP